jgi:putative transposase
MTYDSRKHNRKSIRLKGYDYSQPGGYFVTICTQNKEMLFGDVIDGNVVLNESGKYTQKCWCVIPRHFPDVCLDEFIIMPNHIHGIIFIVENDQNVGIQNFESLHQQKNRYQKIIPRSIGSIIRGFKIGVTKWFRKNTEIYSVWQRNYYEHIIRNEPELNRIRKYIFENPLKWQEDNYF